jgi:hypothetical protein
MGGGPQGAMRVAPQIWQVVFPSQTLQVFCLALRKRAQYVVVIPFVEDAKTPTRATKNQKKIKMAICNAKNMEIQYHN